MGFFTGNIRLDIFTIKHFTFHHSILNGERFCNVATERSTDTYSFRMFLKSGTGRYEILNAVPAWIKALEIKLSDIINRNTPN